MDTPLKGVQLSDVSLVFMNKRVTLAPWRSEELALGSIYRLTCNNCGAEEGYSTGVGMAYLQICEALIKGDLKMLKRVTDDKTYQQVVDVIEGETGKIGFVQNRANFCCPSCNTASHLHEVQVFGLSDGDWTQVLTCDACGEALKQTNRKLENFNCKKCGKAALKNEYAGEWD